MKSELDEQIEILALLQEVRELNDSRRKENELLREQLTQSIQELADQRKLIESKDKYIDTLQKKTIGTSIVTEYLRTWLQVFESKFEAGERPEISEASDYLTHAIWMRDNAGRGLHSIDEVQEWYDNMPAWKTKPVKF